MLLLFVCRYGNALVSIGKVLYLILCIWFVTISFCKSFQVSSLQYRKMDFEEFAASSISVYQLEALDTWEQHARHAYEFFEKEGNRPIMIEELASVYLVFIRLFTYYFFSFILVSYWYQYHKSSQVKIQCNPYQLLHERYRNVKCVHVMYRSFEISPPGKISKLVLICWCEVTEELRPCAIFLILWFNVKQILCSFFFGQELGLSPSVPVHVVLQDWIRHSDGKLSFLGFIKLLHGVSTRSITKA